MMTRPKFAIGQQVDFENRHSSARKPTGPYEITRVLPTEDGGSQCYRIKSPAEPFERIAREFELVEIAREKTSETARS
jgi:hypothetical protein